MERAVVKSCDDGDDDDEKVYTFDGKFNFQLFQLFQFALVQSFTRSTELKLKSHRSKALNCNFCSHPFVSRKSVHYISLFPLVDAVNANECERRRG